MFCLAGEGNLFTLDRNWIELDNFASLILFNFKKFGFISTKLNVKLLAVTHGQTEEIVEGVDVIGEETHVICLAYTGNGYSISNINSLC